MADLDIRFETLESARTNLVGLVDGFSGIKSSTQEAAGYVGHDGLASHVRDFSDGWDKRRDKLTKELQGLIDSLAAISETFLTLDEKLALEVRRVDEGN